MREKLYNLLNTCGKCDKYGPDGCKSCEYNIFEDECEKHLTELMTDDLLNAGVVVLPVKPGDTVYIINHGKITEWKVCSVGINLQGDVQFHVADELYHSVFQFWDYNIGVCVFLTEEDAITELKERKANEQ